MNKGQRSLSSLRFSYVIENVGNDLEGWDGEEGGRDVQVGGDTGKSVMSANWKTQQWPQDWKRPVFILIPNKGNAKECSNYCTIVLILHAGKVMLKIIQARRQQYMN